MAQVPQTDWKAVFEKVAGHPAQQVSRTIVCGDVPAEFEIRRLMANDNRTLSGRAKPGSFAITPKRRTEQFFV